jgi:hypothetical protein
VNKDKPHYLLVSRKAFIAFVTVFITLLIGILASFQYANYVDRKSNGQWCELVGLFNISYKEIPPTTDLGRKIAAAMLRIEEEFKCPNN